MLTKMVSYLNSMNGWKRMLAVCLAFCYAYSFVWYYFDTGLNFPSGLLYKLYLHLMMPIIMNVEEFPFFLLAIIFATFVTLSVALTAYILLRLLHWIYLGFQKQ